MTTSPHPLPERPTTTATPPRPAAWSPRSSVDLLTQQIAGIERFNQALRVARGAQAVSARTREARMDSTRRMEVLRREHQALVDRAQEQLRRTGDLMRGTATRSVLLAHRSEWFLDRVSATLLEHGFAVVARVDNGAEAVGHAVAEQPDLLLVEDSLAMVPGEQVVRDVLRFCPSTRVVAQAADAQRVGPLLEAGATAVYTRRVAPVDVATGMHRLLAA